MPTIDAIDRPDSVSQADMAELLRINKSEWQAELASVKEHYAKFGNRMPKELLDELAVLEKRLA